MREREREREKKRKSEGRGGGVAEGVGGQLIISLIDLSREREVT